MKYLLYFLLNKKKVKNYFLFDNTNEFILLCFETIFNFVKSVFNLIVVIPNLDYRID